MGKIQLIALDLDGTTLDRNKKLAVQTVTAILKARAAGVHIVFDTGRPPVSVREFTQALGMTTAEDYVITYNGGRVASAKGEVLFESSLTYDQVRQVYNWAREEDLPLDIISGSSSYTVEFARTSMVRYINNTITFKSVSFDDIPQDIIFNKIILSAEKEILDKAHERLSAALGDFFEIYKTREFLLEIMPKGIDKAKSLALLCEFLKIPSDNVLAMGDEDNDIPMLSWSGLSIAPANSNPNAKAAARLVSPLSNDEGAVAAAIKDYVLSLLPRS